MKVLHLLASGNYGGIETLVQQYSLKSQLDNIFVFVWGGGDIYDEMKSRGISCINLNEKRDDFLHTVWKILDLCKKERPNVVISHHTAPQFKAVITCLKHLSPETKTIAYAHANGSDIATNGSRVKSFVNKQIHKVGFGSADKIIAISESVKKSLTDVFSVPPDKISVIYNGTDTSKFMPDVREEFHEPIRLIYVGRLVEEKGVQTTLEALRQLPADLNWSFDIVGDGTYRGKLEAQAKEAGISERVHFMGTHGNIPELLKEHDVFIHMPQWEEGFGITVIEAMAAGLLCLCMDKGGIPEIITNGKDGILVQSEEQLIAILDDIVKKSNAALIANIRKNAIERSKNFGISHYVKQLDELIIGV